MTLTDRQKELVRESFQTFQEMEIPLSLLFYGKLFELAPDARQMFQVDMREQARKLMSTLQEIVTALDNLEAIRPTLLDLGRRHIEYGVRPEHYQILVTALLWSFAQALEANFDVEMRAAWAAALQLVNHTMQTAYSEHSN